MSEMGRSEEVLREYKGRNGIGVKGGEWGEVVAEEN